MAADAESRRLAEQCDLGADGEKRSAIVSFKRPGRREREHRVMDAIAAVILAVFLCTTGVSHFVFPAYFRSLVPTWIGPARLLVAMTGVAEIAVGALISVPSARTVGAWMAAILISVYMASHLDAVRHARPDHPSVLIRPLGVAARLLINLGYIGWALWVALAAT
ncbi:hypothetical protein [Nonomuraea sp. B5E05]|uniref:DoxX family protein n=1 Tax=Nonomuraea sp. B5E05 TaxID=3153569 RepID=UPI003261B4EF